ncbi:hypothetical protein KUTeg_009105 [Tegillarca granosa]|uniref:Ig-like domain-containing protein n=1 Tax=Tegillarca granosa TaxID=220873 RepID=A0ABQ9F7L1_TEGGR|nr:hypothetical protein KUTeg_009105 [Tegillarca granosa]
MVMAMLWTMVVSFILGYITRTHLQTLTFSPSTTPLSVVEGQTVILSVTADQSMSQFQWRHNVTLKKSDNDSRTQSSFQIANASKSDGGEYTCTGILLNGSSVSVKKTIDIHYISEAKITPSYRPYIVSIYQVNIQLVCDVDGNPTPSFKWTKGNSTSELSTSSNYKIPSVLKSTAGTYSCTAKNPAGSKNSKLEIIVQYSPIVEFLIDGGQNKAEGERVDFRCTVDSNPKADITIRSVENETFSYAIEDGSSLNATIEKVDCLDAGSYQCSANNSIGKVSTNIKNLFVRCKPRLDHRIYDSNKIFEQTLEIGEDMNITFNLIAYPKPEVRWIFRNAEGRYMQVSDVGYSNLNISAVSQLSTHRITLILTNVTNSDYGEYSALVTNAEGNTILTYKMMKKVTDDKYLIIILGVVFGAIFIILSIVIFVLIRKRGICLKDCRFGNYLKESEDHVKSPVYANKSFHEIKYEKNDFKEEFAETSIRSNYEETIPRNDEEHPYETPVSKIAENEYANWKAGSDNLNIHEDEYANISSKNKKVEGNDQQDPNKLIYENTEPVFKPKKHKGSFLYLNNGNNVESLTEKERKMSNIDDDCGV